MNATIYKRVSLLLVLLTYSLLPRAALADQDTALVVQQLLESVYVALADAQSALADQDLPPLASVELEISVAYRQDDAGRLNLYVVTLGGGQEQSTEQRLYIALKPPSSDEGKAISAPAVLGASLKNAIVAAVKGVRASGASAPTLELATLEAQIAFEIKSEGNAGLQFDVFGLGAEVGSSASQWGRHLLRVRYGEQS